jgi:replicative DNA helicase
VSADDVSPERQSTEPEPAATDGVHVEIDAIGERESLDADAAIVVTNGNGAHRTLPAWTSGPAPGWDDAPGSSAGPSPVDRAPPHDPGAEAAIIGSILWDWSKIELAGDLRAEEFYREPHRQIWIAMRALRAAGTGIDTVTLTSWLRDRGRAIQVGAPGYLIELVSGVAVASAREVAAFATTIRAKARVRHFIEMCARFAAEGHLDIGDADEWMLRAGAEVSASCAPASAKPSTARTPAEIAQGWAEAGPIVRVATGFPALDEACRGGFPIPWRVVVVGAPSGGKTFVVMVLVYRFATIGGLCVGVLGVDEEADPDLNVRLAQMCGFTVAQCEGRDPAVLAQIGEALSKLLVRFYGSSHTIEAAADDLAAWGAKEGRRTALVLDSLQTVRAAEAESAASPRELVDLNVRAMRAKGSQHSMLMIATSEANRSSYRDDEAVDRTNDIAAGKESGSIEFSAQTLIMVRTPKGHANVIRACVPKNRRGARAGLEFFLQLDRDRHSLVECADPSADPNRKAGASAEERARNRARVESDAASLASIIRYQPGVGERGLRAAVKLAGHSWGKDRLDAAKACLEGGLKGQRLTNRGSKSAAAYHLEVVSEGGES